MYVRKLTPTCGEGGRLGDFTFMSRVRFYGVIYTSVRSSSRAHLYSIFRLISHSSRTRH